VVVVSKFNGGTTMPFYSAGNKIRVVVVLVSQVWLV